MKKIKEILFKFKNWFNTDFMLFIDKIQGYIKRLNKYLFHLIGIDGILNLETSALMVCFFSLFLDEILSAIITMVIVVIKTCSDKFKKHRTGEFHDFVCCILGVIIGIMLVGFYGIMKLI